MSKPSINVQFLYFTLYIYLHDFKTLLFDVAQGAVILQRQSPLQQLYSTGAFVPALRQIARLRPRQLITGRQRRRYPNSTSKTDFSLRNRRLSNCAFSINPFDRLIDFHRNSHLSSSNLCRRLGRSSPSPDVVDGRADADDVVLRMLLHV